MDHVAAELTPFLKLRAGSSIQLPDSERFAAAGHRWGQPEIDALILASASRRPLLVRGEAGSGKSQIARAAAHVFPSCDLLVEVIHPRFEALDLLYTVDHVRRLADAHVNALDPTNERYVKHGRLWEAMERAQARNTVQVLLIDEIDKADADIPNALLDVLGNRSFSVPALDNRAVSAGDAPMPLVIITTNEERELPPAFVRRCIVLNLNPPRDDVAFARWLVERGRVHKHLVIEDDARTQAAKQVLADRKIALAAGFPSVGLAEYVDLVSALHELTVGVEHGEARARAQLEWLGRLSAYALVKHADQAQDRPPVDSGTVGGDDH